MKLTALYFREAFAASIFDPYNPGRSFSNEEMQPAILGDRCKREKGCLHCREHFALSI
jgi:hypothetical protein